MSNSHSGGVGHPPSAGPDARLPRRLVLFLAIATGVAVANIYYPQPLLHLIARSFGLAPSAAGPVVTLSQLGFALGLLIFVPLGDRLEWRGLVTWLSGGTALGLLGMGFAPTPAILYVAAFLVGLLTVVPQVLLPAAARMAPDESRGRLIGTVMSGLIMGQLGARVVGGFVGQAFGWRAVMFLAAALMGLLAVSARPLLPALPPLAKVPAQALARSLLRIVRESSPMRQAALTGAVLFASFTGLWTVLTPHLAGPPFHYPAAVIGLFGLVGLAGATVAPVAGHLADRHPSRLLVGIGIAVCAIAAVLMLVFGETFWGMAAGVLLLDAGMQFGHVSNQSRVFAEQPEARGRRNTVYMVSLFIGGAVGSAVCLVAYRSLGWPGVPLVLLVLLGLGVLLQPLV